VATVFISHASADTDVALRVERWLTDAGHAVLLDRSVQSGIGLGDDWRLRIEAWLRAADAMVCLVTAAYVASQWGVYEIAAARTQGCLVLPLVVEPGVRHPQLETLQHTALADPADERAGETVLAALRRLDDTGGVGWPDGRSPFPGLAPFDRDRRGVFCGRAADVNGLVQRLVSEPIGLLPVVGPSGCGKSSLVRAGLVPAMAALPGWLVLEPFTPGQDPVGGLARAISVASGGALEVAAVRARLERAGLLGVATDLLDAAGSSARRLLMVVDQFEELYVSAGQDRFLDVLRSAADAPVQVVATLRSSDLDLLLAEPDLPVAEPRILRPLGRAALRAVIEEPAKVARLTVDDELIARMVDDTGDGDALPLLAYTLAELARGLGPGDALAPERYEWLDGVQGALCRQAEAALVEAEQATGRTREQVLDGLLALVTVDAQRLPAPARVDRTSLSREDAAALTPFVERRLVTEERDSYRVVHEMVLANWPPLRDAIAAIRPRLSTRDRIDATAADWVAAGCPADWDELWVGDQLAAALVGVGATIDRRDRAFGQSARISVGPVPLTSGAQRFLLASHRRDRRARRRATTVLAALLVAALVATGVTTALWRTTRDQQTATLARQLMAQADAVRPTDPATALRLGLAAAAVHPADDTRSALAAQITTTRFAGALADERLFLDIAEFTADGRTMMTQANGAVVLWDVTHSPPVRRVALPAPGRLGYDAAAMAADGRRLAAAAAGRVQLWDVRDPAIPRPTGPAFDVGPTADLGADPPPKLVFSTNGRILAVARAGGVQLFDVSGPAAPRALGSPIATGGDVGPVAFDQADRALLTGIQRPVRNGDIGPSTYTLPGLPAPRRVETELVTWDITDPAAPRPVGPRIPYSTVAVSPGRDLVAVANVAGGPNVTLWDFRDPRAPRAAGRIAPVDTTTAELAFSPDGATLAVAGGERGDRWLGLWSVTAPDRPRALLTGKLGGDREPDGVELVPDLSGVRVLAGRPQVAIVDTDGRLTVHDYAEGDLRLVGMAVTPGPGRIVAVLPDGATALADDGNLWDLTDRWIPTRLAVPEVEGAAAAAEVRFVGDSRVLAVARQDGAVDLLDLADPSGPAEVRRVAPAQVGGAARLPAIALSPGADLLAVARPDGGATSVTVHDLEDPSRSARFPIPANPTPDSDAAKRQPGVALTFTPAGLLAVRSGQNSPAGPGSLTMWDVADLARPRALGPPVPSDGLMSASRDGDLAVRFAGSPGNLQVVDVAAAGGPAPLGSQVPFSDRVAIPHAGLAPDGRTLAMPDGVLWDLGTPSAPRQLGTVTFGADGYAFSPDGRTLAAARQTGYRGYRGLSGATSELQLWDVADRDLPRQLSSVTAKRSRPAGWWYYDDDLGPVFAADGAVLVATDAGVIRAWDIGKLIAVRADPGPAACAVAVRGLDRSEWARYIGGEAYVDTCAA
jgi:Novel STAND NTPase 1/TIR domain